ncbi:MAG: DEAD/DEAH box helicase [Nitrospirae bacterium]|nr:DEAD/DEAH box helicase [Nitrospirota bacterium]
MNSESTFEAFGLNDALLKGVKEAGFLVPSPIQEQAIPFVMKGRDVIAQAQTGTGKTAAFGLAAMNSMSFSGDVELLVIIPTRELASQVSDEIYRLGRFAGVRTVAVYGGQSISRQVDLVQRGAQVVTATPGRLLDHLRSGRFKRFKPSIVVLDEADEMLDMGFIEDIEAIFQFLPKERQTLLFSATVPEAIRRLAKTILKDPVTIDVTPKGLATAPDVTHKYYVIEEREREEALVRLIDAESAQRAIIFCRTKRETDNLSTTLISRGYSAKALHGDMEQNQRNEVMDSFRQAKIELLVATDVAARGLDITDVTHVFNFHIPFDPESYVHRIGRTGRAGKSGIAITLVTPLEFKELNKIMEFSGAPIIYEEIPDIGQVKKQYHATIMEKLHREPINEDALDIFRRLSQDMDISQIAYKALSMLVEKQHVKGPNRIGLTSLDVERIMHKNRRQKSPKNTWLGRDKRRRS